MGGGFGDGGIRWTTYPGLFAGGAVDVMTTVMLHNMPTPPKRARVLDFCCGSGVIAASLLSSEPSLRLYLSDADALAVRAAKINVPEAKAVVLSDCWDALPAKPKKFNWIVSNPPVHLGIQTDFRVLRTLIAGASKRLKPGGQLWLVTQTYVPVGALLAKQQAAGKLCEWDAHYEDGRFTVWRAKRAEKSGQKNGKRKRGEGSSEPSKNKASKKSKK